MITIFLILTLIKILEFKKAKSYTTEWHDRKYRYGQLWDLTKQFIVCAVVIALYEFDLIANLLKWIF